jgi:hypothetical protein
VKTGARLLPHHRPWLLSVAPKPALVRCRDRRQ